MLTSVVSVFFYLRIVVMMYMVDEQGAGRTGPCVPAIALAGLLIALAGVFYLGVLPAACCRSRPSRSRQSSSVDEIGISRVLMETSLV